MKKIYVSSQQTTTWQLKHAWFFLFAFTLIGTWANAQTAPPCTVNIGGKVFSDFNNNGVLNTTDSLGFAGIKVYAFNCAGVKIDSAVTDSKGNYTLTKVTAADDSVRIEFVASSFPAWAKPTYNGTSGRTDVQFVKAPNCSVNLGMVSMNDYCNTNPRLATPCYIDGAVSPNVTAYNDVLVSFNYNVGIPNKLTDAARTEIGSTWGLAYARSTQKMYASAFLKRHVGLKDAKLGAIYVKDYANPAAAATLWLDVSTLAGINGSWTYLTDADRGLGNAGSPSLDADAFKKIATVGLGDIDISGDDKTLYVMDLTNRQLLAIDIATKALIGKYPVPEICPDATAGPMYYAAGSAAFTATDGKKWQKGSVLNSENNAIVYAQTIGNANNATQGTTDQTLYTTSVYSTDSINYNFPMGNGTYSVKMHFGTNTTITNRNTSVKAEGVTVLSGIDVFTAVGVNNATTRTFTATVTDGILSINTINGTGSSYVAVSGFEITPTSGQKIGITRPFATKYRNGKVYVGAVCDASISQNRDDLKASIFVFDPVTGSYTATPALTFPLTFLRGASVSATGATTGSNNRWEPWTTVYPNNTAEPFGIAAYAAVYDIYTQPVLSDIEFDNDGSMIIGFFDRFPHQIGASYNYRPDRSIAKGLTSKGGVVGGDILRAYFNGTSYELENNGKEGVSSSKPATSGAGSLEGPGGGEFYHGDELIGFHYEIGAGGLAMLPGSGEIRATTGDPLAIYTGGVAAFDNTNGIKIIANSITLYGGVVGGTQNKANGLGDLELICNPQPIQIGNRLWIDTDKDGVQDPCKEPGLKNVVVSLYSKAGVFIAKDTTDANGEYYFGANNVVDTLGAAKPNFLGPQPNTQYYVVIGKETYGTGAQFDKTAGSITLSGKPYSLTVANSTANNGNDRNDSDFELGAGTTPAALLGYPVFCGTTPSAGADHTFDAGFTTCNTPTIASATQTPATCNGTVANADATITLTVTNGDKYAVGITTAYASATAFTGSFTKTAQTAGSSLTFRIFNGSDVCYKDTTITVTPQLCPAPVCSTNIGGKVFNDFNNNGVLNTTDSLGFAGIKVYAFNCAGVKIDSAVTDSKGNYTLTKVTAADDSVRIEFVASTFPTWAKPTYNGTSGRTDVQFVKAPDCRVDMGMVSMNDYCQTNPFIAIPCYENGLASTNANTGIVGFPYNSTGVTGPKTKNANINEVGSVWGTAYQSNQQRLFAGTLLKRHVGTVGNSFGRVFVLDYKTSTIPVTSFDLQGVAPVSGPILDFGTVNRTAAVGSLPATDFQLSSLSTTPNIDLDAYTKVGKIGYGDVDLDEAGNRLWLVNTFQQSLINVDVSGATLPGAVNNYELKNLPGYATCPVYTNTATTTIRIDAGASTGFTDSNGNAWVAEQYGTGGLVGTNPATLTNLGNTYETTNASQSLYQSIRYGNAFNYAVPVTNGSYQVVIHFRSIGTAAAQNDIRITAEGAGVSNDDLFTSPNSIANRATTVQFVADVADGTLNLGFTASVGTALVSGIEIIPLTSGVSGEVRPWGLAFHNGKGYLGTVCDASKSFRRADMAANVLEFDPNNIAAGFTTVLNIPLNYRRENTNVGSLPGHWTAWRSDITMVGKVGDPSFRQNAPQPILSDIDFSENGSMIIGFMDRTSNQEGFGNNIPYSKTTSLNGSGPRVAGDIIQACLVNGAFVLEQGNSGTTCKCTDTGGTGQLTNDGPSNGGEFYNDDNYIIVGKGEHAEVVTGGLAQLKGSNEILATVYDPTSVAANQGVFSQGVHWYNNKTGAKTDGFTIVEFTGNLGNASDYLPTIFGKANALGDPSLRCNPLPVQIGNRLWIDTDRDGVQDPCKEPGLKNVVVSLYSKAGVFIAKDTTDANGEYYFGANNVVDTLGAAKPNFLGPQPNTQYYIVIGKETYGTGAQFDKTAGTMTLSGKKYELTIANSTNSSGNNQNDSDFELGAGTTTSTLLGFPVICETTPSAGANHTFDAGFKPQIALGSIGDLVFKDTNKNGLQEATEAGVNNVKVILTTAAGVFVDSTRTAGGGKYLFSNLPKGNYVVEFVKSTLPAACNAFTAKDTLTNGQDKKDSDADKTTGKTGTISLDPVLLTATSTPADSLKTNNLTVDAGLLPLTPLGSIGDLVFKDTNKNGLQEVTEIGVNGVKVILTTAAGVFVDSTRTAGGGKYLFSNLPKGDYVVEFVKSTLPAACNAFTAKDTLTNGQDKKDSDADKVTGKTSTISLDPVLLTATSTPADSLKTNNLTVDAGLLPLTPLGSIGDLVFKDTNKNGLQDATEVGVNGVKVILTTAAGVFVDSTRTAGGGKYLFSNLPKGNYVVEFVKSTLPADCNAFTAKDTLTNGQDKKDSDADKTTGKTGTISLDPVLLTATSTPADSLKTNNLTVDAGLLPLTSIGSIGDLVFKDANKNGLQDATEVGVNGVKVILTTAAGVFVDSTRTAGGGKYLFSNLPKGDYVVEFVKSTLPADCNAFTAKDTLTNGQDAKDSDADKVTGKTGTISLDPVLLTAASTPADSLKTNNLTVDAGLLPKNPLGSIGDLVFKDTNKNGLQEVTEIGVNGVKVILTTAAGVFVDSTRTASGGKYLFSNLPKGDYVVEFVKSTLPAACNAFTAKDTLTNGQDKKDSDADKTTGKTGTISLDPVLLTATSTPADSLKTNNLTVDAGLLPLTPLGSIGDLVFKDANKNGLQDATEVGVNNMKVILTTAAGVFVDSTRTALGGKYLFSNLPKGDYVVEFVKATLPADCNVFTAKDTLINGQDKKDSDADKVTGKTGIISLDPVLLTASSTPADSLKTNNLTVDAGVLPKTPLGSIGDLVFKDTNKNGLQEATEAGVNNVKVILTTAAGVFVDSTRTALGGKYLFSNLPKGDYIVEFVKATLPAACNAFTAKDTLTNGQDKKDSDADKVTGKTGTISLDPVLLTAISTPADSLKTNNLTVDAGVISLKGSLGDYVWKDKNNNGKQDLGEAGVKGVIIELYKNGIIFAKDTTDNLGKYGFVNLDSASYYIKVVTGSLPDSCAISQKVNAAGVADDLNSDVSPVTYKSQTVIIDPTPTAGVSTKDNPTLDVALRLKPRLAITDPCSCFRVEYDISEKKELYEQLTVTTTPGETWKVIQQTGMLQLDSLVKTPVALGTLLTENPVGEYKIPYTIEDNIPYTVTVTNGIDTLKYANVCINNYPDISLTLLNNTICKNAAAVPLSASSIPAANSYEFFYVDKLTMQRKVITAFDPSIFSPNDTVYVKMKVGATNPKSCPVIIVQPITVVTIDCEKGTLGDFVWKDTNNNGKQDTGEVGIKDVKLKLLNAAGKYVATGLLSGNQQVPPVTTTASGAVTTELDTVTNVLTLRLKYTGLSSAPTMAHIHAGNAGTNGGVIAALSGFPTSLTASYNTTVTLTAAQKAQYLANGLYVNIHTVINGGGELRAQLNACAITDALGKYQFSNLDSATYRVMVVKSSLINGCVISAKPNATTANDDTDSDFNPTTGVSDAVTVNPKDLTMKDIRTVDLAVVTPLGSIGDLVFKDANKNGLQDATEAGVNNVKVILTTAAGVFVDSTRTALGGKYLFSNLPKGDYVVEFVKATLPADCNAFTAKDTLTNGQDKKDSDADKVTGKTGTISLDPVLLTATSTPADSLKTNNLTVDAGLLPKTVIDINCVQTPPISVLGPTIDACIGKAYPQLSATIVGTGVVDWYKKPAGGTAVAAATLTYTPTGNVAINDTFYLAARSTLPTSANCPVVIERTRVIVVAKNCADTVDLALKKVINKKIAQIGDVVTYTIKVWNQSKTNATGVEVTDQLPAGVQYMSSTPSRGNYSNATGIWTIGNIAAAGLPAAGDTVSLTINVKVLMEGLTFNTAEISKTTEKDKDSTPGNGIENEDDIDRICFTVPVKLCSNNGSKVEATVPATYKNVKWSDGQTGNMVRFSVAGTYSFTADNGQCPTGGCCPVIVELINCCPAEICVPFTITKRKR